MDNRHSFRAEQLASGYDDKTILQNINLEIPANKISVIIGSNGCGKSTLLKTLAKLIKPSQGDITLDGKNISKIPPKKLAQILGVLPQSPIVITINIIVSLFKTLSIIVLNPDNAFSADNEPLNLSELSPINVTI